MERTEYKNFLLCLVNLTQVEIGVKTCDKRRNITEVLETSAMQIRNHCNANSKRVALHIV